MTLHSLNLCCLRVDCILDHNLCPRPSILSCRIGEFWVVLRMPFTGPRGKNGKKWGNVPALGELGNSMGREEYRKFGKSSYTIFQVYLPTIPSSLGIGPTI